MNKYRLPEKPQQDAFGLPEDYFRQFQEAIEAKVDILEASSQEEVQVVPLWTKFKPYLYAAAMFVLLFVGIRGGLHLTERNTQPIAQDLLNSSDDMPLESDYTAEEFVLGTLNSHDFIYYLFEDAITPSTH